MALVCLFSDNFSYFRHTVVLLWINDHITIVRVFILKPNLEYGWIGIAVQFVRDISNVIVYNMRSFSVCIIFIICIINVNIIAMQKRYL